HREGQRRQRERERPPDMSRAEQIDDAGACADRLGPTFLIRQGRRQTLSTLLAFQPSLDSPLAPDRRPDRGGSAAFRGCNDAEVAKVATIERFDAPLDAPATTLRELRSQRQRAAQRRAAPLLQRRL